MLARPVVVIAATIKLAYTKNEQVEIVATVVVVGVKLARPPRVEQAQQLWAGVIRSQLLNQTATVGRRLVICIMGIYVSTLKIQTTPVAAMKNVFAQRPVNRALTKTKPVYHLVKYVRPERASHCQGKVCVAKARLALHVICKVNASLVKPIIT